MKRFVGRSLQLALFVVGFTLFVVGVLYLITPVEALPSFLGGIHRADVHVEPRFEPVQDPPEADVLPVIGPGDEEMRRESRHGARC